MKDDEVDLRILSTSIRHYLRRTGFKFRHPKEFYAYQQKRASIHRSGYSYKPFDDTKSIFVHIPKCAGTALSRTLYGCFAGGHTTLKEYQLIFSPYEFQRYFKFTIVRNPWDRLVSAFLFLKQGGMDKMDREWATQHLDQYKTFSDFVVYGLSDPSVLAWHHFRPQLEFITLDGITPAVDYTGKYETLQTSFKYICDRLGIKSPLERVNSTKSRMKGFREYYTPETESIVADVYKDDIKVLGYSLKG